MPRSGAGAGPGPEPVAAAPQPPAGGEGEGGSGDAHVPTVPGPRPAGRVVGGEEEKPLDGWTHRNTLLQNLRRVIPHDLRLRTPVRLGMLLQCRTAEGGWTPADGPWMWALNDACHLHGLRTGPYLTLTDGGWQVLGEDRHGRTPRLSERGEPARIASVHPMRSGYGTVVGHHTPPPAARRRTAAR
ncbi:hypothetical protein [Allostreptomyces psammosilenae]|uniref:hypothetical protein n=1 Tax=Allostreptomyces psammosilenae TaxID=1892865 RepID=UPI00406BBD26